MNQMLLFSYETGNGKFYPYREAFKFMREVKELGFIDFVYSVRTNVRAPIPEYIKHCVITPLIKFIQAWLFQHWN